MPNKEYAVPVNITNRKGGIKSRFLAKLRNIEKCTGKESEIKTIKPIAFKKEKHKLNALERQKVKRID